MGNPSKTWPTRFSCDHKPMNDHPVMEQWAATILSQDEELGNSGIQLFMEYDHYEITPKTALDVVRYCKNVRVNSLFDENRIRLPGTVWMNDQTRSVPGYVELPSTSCSGCTDSEEDHNASNETQQEMTNTRANLSVPHSGSTIQVLVAPVTPRHAGAPDHAQTHQYNNGSHHQSLSLGRTGTRQPRKYNTPLTAGDLYTHLREKRYNHSHLLDADRRVIYIADPDAYHFAALAHTAPEDQHRALKHMMSKYLKANASVRATIPDGYSFQLEFHLPYFKVKSCHPEQQFNERKKRTHRGWMKANFLHTGGHVMPEGHVLGINQGQVSFTICGSDNGRWTAYFFEDRYFEDDHPFEEEYQPGIEFDPITGLADKPAIIWDAREYFLLILLGKAQMVRRNWEELVEYIEEGIGQHSWVPCFFSTSRDGLPSETNSSTASETINLIWKLVGKLLGDISKTNNILARFTSESGDLQYFSDLLESEHNHTGIRTNVDLLREIFDDLKNIEQRLRTVQEQCEKCTQALNLRFTSESNRNTHLTVYFVSPIALASTFFAIPAPILSFERNFGSFFISMIVIFASLKTFLFLCGGGLARQSWWEKISKRGREILSGNACLAATDKNGINRLRRRNTQAVSC